MDDKETPKPNEVPVLPSMFQMIKSFSKEVIDYIKQGAPNVTAADYAERLDTCTACPHIIKKNMRCSLCGCAMQHKAKWTTSKCPDNPSRWKKQIIKDQNVKLDNQNIASLGSGICILEANIAKKHTKIKKIVQSPEIVFYCIFQYILNSRYTAPAA